MVLPQEGPLWGSGTLLSRGARSSASGCAADPRLPPTIRLFPLAPCSLSDSPTATGIEAVE